MSDHELLQRYARENSQPAFATLVARHLDLVYSAARRQVRSPQLAEEVAQSVFIELSRGAAKLPATQPLAAWLYVVTRRTAIDALRQESRRLARETAAAEIAAMKTPPEAWSKVEASIDEAMATLNDTDRSAIILRFFQNLSLREVGESLGISEDTAQKRVSRALDRLRTFFGRRGVAVSAAGLATDLSAHAIQTAPTTLGSAICVATPLGAVATTEAVRTLAMTTLQKSVLAVAMTVAVGIAVFEGKTMLAQRTELRVLLDSNAALAARLATARSQADATTRSLNEINVRLVAQRAAAARPKSDPSIEAQMRAWFQRVQHIRDVAARNSHQLVPEVHLLTEEYWFELGQNPQLSDDNALLNLRGTAKANFSMLLMEASSRYVKEHGGQLPPKVNDLKPYLRDIAQLRGTQADDAMFARYAVRYTGALANVPKAERGAVFVEIASPDENDQRMVFGPDGGTFRYRFSDLTFDTRFALWAFNQAKPGATPATGAELLPYFIPPLSSAREARFLAEAENLLRR